MRKFYEEKIRSYYEDNKAIFQLIGLMSLGLAISLTGDWLILSGVWQ